MSTDDNAPVAWGWTVNGELTGVKLNKWEVEEIAERWNRPAQHNRHETRGGVVSLYLHPADGDA